MKKLVASLKSTSDKGWGKRLFGKIMGFGHSVTSEIKESLRICFVIFGKENDRLHLLVWYYHYVL